MGTRIKTFHIVQGVGINIYIYIYYKYKFIFLYIININLYIYYKYKYIYILLKMMSHDLSYLITCVHALLYIRSRGHEYQKGQTLLVMSKCNLYWE